MSKSDDDRDVSLLAFDQYMREVKHLAPLNPEEEERLFDCIVQARSQPENLTLVSAAREARDRLVARFQPLVICIARKYRWLCHHLDVEDLIQEGNLGLLLALSTHQPGPQRTLVGFIGLCVHQSIRAVLRDWDPLVRLPKNVAVEVSQLLHHKRHLEANLGYEPTVEQLAKQMKLSLSYTHQLLGWSAFVQVSSIEALVGDEGESDQMRFMRLDYQSPDGEETMPQGRYQIVREAVEGLPPRQREVTWLRYGFDGGQTLRSWDTIAQMTGLTYGAVASSEHVARKRLRPVLAELCEVGSDEVA